MHDRTGTHEQQPLHKAMAERMHEHRREGDHSHRAMSRLHEQHAAAKGRKNDAHILDRRIGQDAFHILLHRGVKHAEERREQAHDHDNEAISKDFHAEEIEDKAAQSVDGDLEHDTAHQGRYMAWRCRMRIRQPDMQRHQAGFQGKADKGRTEGHMTQRPFQRVVRQIREQQALRLAAHQVERHKDSRRAQMGHDHILIGGMDGILLLALMIDEQERHQCHDLPSQDKRKRIASHEHEHHREQEQVPKPRKSPDAHTTIRLAIIDAIQTDNGTSQSRNDEKSRAPSISSKIIAAPASIHQQA